MSLNVILSNKILIAIMSFNDSPL